MFEENKAFLSNKTLNARALHGRRYKILARWVHVVIPKGKHTTTIRDTLIDMSEKARKNIDSAFTDIAMLHEMSKITGTFLPCNSINMQAKERITATAINRNTNRYAFNRSPEESGNK